LGLFFGIGFEQSRRPAPLFSPNDAALLSNFHFRSVNADLNFGSRFHNSGFRTKARRPLFSIFDFLFCEAKFGGGGPNLCEPEPLTSKVVIAALWKKEQIDLAELARLRWVEKWSNQRLADYFGMSPTTAKGLLRRIKANPGLAGLREPPPVIRGRA
jgi:hypothetical protein